MPHDTPESVSAVNAAAALRSVSPQVVTLLHLYGEDAFSYLQSQVSADLRVSGGQWLRYALWLDSGGHVQADSFILRLGAESFLLFSYNTPAERLEEIALANVIADDVEVEHLGGYTHWALWAVAAAGGALLPQQNCPQAGCFTLINLADSPPPAVSGADAAGVSDAEPRVADLANAALLFAGRNCGGENYDLLLPAGAALPPFVATVGEVSWAAREAQRIADGVPAIPADIGLADLPQEGGDLPRVAVSTSKGCYLGQEVVARWHATGQVRSGLFRLQLLAGASAVTERILAVGGGADNGAGGSAGDGALGGAGATAAGAAGVVSRATSALPLRLYAGTKPVGELRSFAPAVGAGLALLRIHRLGEVRELALEAGGENIFSVREPMLS